MKYFWITIFLAGCGLFKTNKPKPSIDPHEALRAKYELYLGLAAGQLDAAGFVAPKCDSLLFSSLAGVAGLRQIPVVAAERSPGEWHRHPSFTCYPNESKSTISKDMFVGLFHYLWKTKNVDAMRRINTYGSEHNWFMGEAVDFETKVSRTLLSLPMISLLQSMIGMSLVENSEDGIGVKPGFEGHLHVLRLYLDALVHGATSSSDLSTLESYTRSYPRNALYNAIYHRYSDGEFTTAVSVLMDESLFPADRLPTSQNYCTHYLWQRDPDEDWLPCDEGLTHSGVDFLYAASIILGV